MTSAFGGQAALLLPSAPKTSPGAAVPRGRCQAPGAGARDPSKRPCRRGAVFVRGPLPPEGSPRRQDPAYDRRGMSEHPETDPHPRPRRGPRNGPVPAGRRAGAGGCGLSRAGAQVPAADLRRADRPGTRWSAPLTNAIRTGRLAHAFVLTGVRGVGKTTTPPGSSPKALNCTGPDGKRRPRRRSRAASATIVGRSPATATST